MELNPQTLNNSHYFTLSIGISRKVVWLSANTDELKVLGYDDKLVHSITYFSPLLNSNGDGSEMCICYEDGTEDSFPLNTDIHFSVFRLLENI